MIKPGDFLAVVASAELRTVSGDWPEAAALWAQVTAENLVNGDYWARLAEAQFASQEYAAAHQAYEKVRELGVRPGHQQQYREDLSELLPGEVAYRIACCRAALGQRDEAIDALTTGMPASGHPRNRTRTSPACSRSISSCSPRACSSSRPAPGSSTCSEPR